MVSRTTIILTIVMIIIALASLWVTVRIYQASIDYWMDENATFNKGLQSFWIHCKNGGGMDGDFSLVLTFINVTFSTQTLQPYLQPDNSTVEFRWLLHKDESAQKQVFFYANNTEEFAIGLSLARTNPWDYFLLTYTGDYPTYQAYMWNETQNCFVSVASI